MGIPSIRVRLYSLKISSCEIINVILVLLSGIRKRYISLSGLIKIMDQFLYIILRKKVRIYTISYVNNLTRGVRKTTRFS